MLLTQYRSAQLRPGEGRAAWCPSDGTPAGRTARIDCLRADMLYYAPLAVAKWRSLLQFRALVPFVVGRAGCAAAAEAVKLRLQEVRGSACPWAAGSGVCESACARVCV